MTIYFALDLISTAIFAYAGAESAKRNDFHVVGVFVTALVTGIGGGSMRALLLQEPSLFWISSNDYLIVIGLTVLYTMQPLGQINTQSFHYQLLDGFALAVFISIGFSVAINQAQPTHIACAMGILTGIGGGIIRDAITRQTPQALCDRSYPFLMIGGIAGSFSANQAGWPGWTLAVPIVVLIVFTTRVYQTQFAQVKLKIQ